MCQIHEMHAMFVFQASPDTQVFYTSLEAFVQLSEVVGSALNPHLKALLPQVTLKTLNVHFANLII